MNERNLELAGEAGLQQRIDDPNEVWGYRENLQRFAELIRADEREACAVTAENYSDTYHHFGLCKRAAEAIRARGANDIR